MQRRWRHGVRPCNTHAVAAARASRFFTFSRIPKDEYAARRTRFLNLLEPNTLVVLPAADESVLSNDILRRSRQESMFYHLFGLTDPMRKALCPPGSNCPQCPDGFRMTCAVFARFPDSSSSGSSAEAVSATATVRLFTMPATDSAETWVWASHERGLPQTQKSVFTQAEELAGCSVLDNSMDSVLRETVRLVTSMASANAKSNKQYASLLRSVEAGSTVSHSSLRRLNPLPTLMLHMPSQLRFSGEVFRWPTPTQPCVQGARSSSARYVTSVHPLDAFMQVLGSFALTLDGGVGRSAKASYRTQPLQRTTATLSFSDEKRRQLQCLLPELLKPTVNVFPKGEGKKISAEEIPLPPSVVRLPNRLVSRYRFVKSPSQVTQHLYSAAATQQAFLSAMRRAARTTSEHSIHVAFQEAAIHLSERLGAEAGVRLAYIPVVAAGSSASQIHYTANNAADADAGSLMRLDGGLEVDHVPTDCTRTFPVGASRFGALESCTRRKLFTGVLKLQRALLQALHSDVAVSEVAQLHVDLTARLLLSVGIQPQVRDAASADGQESQLEVMRHAVRRCFCAHSFGHFFGLDVHEVPPPQAVHEKGGSRLAAGAVHTVEPGVYVPGRESPALEDISHGVGAVCIPSALLGTGIQIEDDVLVLPPAFHDATTCNSAHAIPAPWSRTDYLLAACDAFKNLMRPLDGATPGSWDPLFIDFFREKMAGFDAVIGSLHGPQLVAFLLLFTQRVCIQGLYQAEALLHSDAARVRQYVSGSSESPIVRADWYPFDLLVLTAMIPKDAELIEYVMQAAPPP